MRGLIAPSSLVSIRRNALSTSSKPEFMRSQRDLFQPTGVTCKQPLRQELNPELALSLPQHCSHEIFGKDTILC